MPSALPAMRGHFGSTEFFLVTMHAKELTERLVIPKDLEGWEDLTLEERFQRDVNYTRVKKHIAPYLANDEDRFFGAFIVAMMNHDGVEFEGIDKISREMPRMYANAASAFGFLNLRGDEILVPLDGQHRLAAINFAISAKDEKGKNIAGLDANPEIAKDMCTVMLVRYEDKKARKIFNKVNRYAKPTSKADNLITADDDIVAIITREDIANELIGSRLVRCGSNTLPVRVHEFTTLSTLYEATGLVLEDTFGKIDRTMLPDPNKIKNYRETAIDFWQHVCEGVQLFQAALHDPSDSGDQRRVEIRRDYVLGKPIAQLALVGAILRCREEEPCGSRLSWRETIAKVNEVDWEINNPLWQGVLMRDSKRVVAGKTAARFAARFIAYYLGRPLSSHDVKQLSDDYQSRMGPDTRQLPPPVGHHSSEPLPIP